MLLQKRLVLSNREDALREQQRVLEELAEAHGPKGESFIGTGGMLKTVDCAIGEGEGVAASVLGSFDNADHLVKRYLGENFSQNANPQSAELVCHLYKVFGRVLPQKLKGDFSFLLFDPSQGRVLAAVSPTWKAPLLQARGADGSLIITSSSHVDLPPGAHSLLLIPPGSLKYGWSSEPQEYAQPSTPRRGPVTPRRGLNTPPDPQTPRGRPIQATAYAAAKRALSSGGTGGTEEDSFNSVQTSEQSFADSEGGEPQSPAPKKTRRGKRAGKNQKLRAEQMSQRLSMDGNAPLTDFQRMASLQSVASSFTSRADEQNWWRTDTPRQSLDLSSLASGSMPPAPVRRASMSATAPPFVPSKPNFSRQSVPAARSRTSALSFDAPRSHAPLLSCLDSHAFVVGPRVSTSQLSSDERPAASPFEDLPSASGRADAAWHEENPPLSAPSGRRPPVQPSTSGRSLGRSSGDSVPVEGSPVSAESEDPSGGKGADGQKGHTGRVGGSGLPVSLPRLVTQGSRGRAGSQAGSRGGSPRGTSPRGASPGGSPHKPPRAPGKAGIKQFFKAMTSKRPSQVDLRADGTDATAMRNRARSASHGNLLGLGEGAARPPSSGHGSGSESSTSLVDAGTRKPGKPAHRKQPSREHEEALMLSNLKISGPDGQAHPHPPTSASWLARTTRSIFSKSKSCNDLRDLQVPVATQTKMVS